VPHVRSNDIYDVIVKLNTVIHNVLAKTMIQDICEIANIKSIIVLTIADDK
jgi:hypothetical protein